MKGAEWKHKTLGTSLAKYSLFNNKQDNETIVPDTVFSSGVSL